MLTNHYLPKSNKQSNGKDKSDDPFEIIE